MPNIRKREPRRRQSLGPFKWLAIGLAILVLAAIAAIAIASRSSGGQGDELDVLARRYVELGLEYAAVEPGSLDFYFGPEELIPAAGEAEPGREAIRGDLEKLRAQLAAEPSIERRDHLANKVASLIAIIDASKPDENLSFAQQAQLLYGVEVVAPDDARMQHARKELDAMLPGHGPLAKRADAYAAKFVIREDLRRSVFMRAVGECRKRTAAHWALPPDETLEVEWTDGVDAAWHKYRGDGHSVLQVNPAAIADIGSALDVACHEAYPGHHAQFLAQRERGAFAVEDRLVFTRSAEQLLREGAAEFGVELAFPLKERISFLREELFPLADFEPERAEAFAKFHAARQALGGATAPILSDYLDGRLTAYDAGQALQNEALVSSGDALLGFARRQGAYVLGYSLARDAVAACVTARAGRGAKDAQAQWQALYEIVASSDLSALKGAACPG